MRFLFIADPIQKLQPTSDTSFALLRDCLAKGYECWWTDDRGISASSHHVQVRANHIIECASDRFPTPATTPLISRSIEDFDAVFIRKDPPFDMNYIQLCWVLSYAESKVYFMNRPSLLARYHEKILPIEAVAQGFLSLHDIIPTFFGNWEGANQYFHQQGTSKVVVKPFWGFGGSDVQLLSRDEFAARTESASALRDQIVQPFQEEIAMGDRRVFMLDGEVLCHVVRVPKAGSIISNLAQGGTAVSKPLREQESVVLEKLGKFLKFAGIHLAGADVIGGKISEVNITSPTGLRSIEALEGRDFSREIIFFAEKCAFYGRT